MNNEYSKDILKDMLNLCLKDLKKITKLLHKVTSLDSISVDKQSEIEKFKHSSIHNLYSQVSAMYIYLKSQRANPICKRRSNTAPVVAHKGGEMGG